MEEQINIDKAYLENAYINKCKSIRVISEETGKSPSTIRRLLIRYNIDLRNKSNAQKQALKTGRAPHPTQGKKRDPETKIKISDGVAAAWKKLSPEEVERRREIGRQQWENMDEKERTDLLEAAREAVRGTSRDGSRIEKFLAEGLTNAGFKVDYHKEGLIPNVKMQLDIWLPELGTAIEVDGPAHFLPVWGEEKLAKTIESDIEKTGLLLDQNMVIIRIKYLKRYVTSKSERNVLSAVLSCLEKIRIKKPPKHERLIEIEI